MISPKLFYRWTIALFGLLAMPCPGQAQLALPNPTDPIQLNATPPPSTGRPGRRSDAGSRGCGNGESADASSLESKPLLALVPLYKSGNSAIVFGKTATASPTFWFYVPYRLGASATFVLQDSEGNPLHQTDVPLPKASGLVSVTLPATAPLSLGQPYHWFFKLYCRSDSPPDSFVDGWVQRESPKSNLTQTLKTATLSQQIRLYAANGFWFESLTTAAELRHNHGDSSAWVELLRAIGLENVATEKHRLEKSSE